MESFSTDAEKSNVLSFKNAKPSEFVIKLREAREICRDARSGGRCLNAIWERKDLTTGEKAILCQIGAFQDYSRKSFTDYVEISIKRLAERASMSVRGVQQCLRSLESRKLISIKERNKENGAAIPNEISLSHRLFSDFARVRKAKLTGKNSRFRGEPELLPHGGKHAKNQLPPRTQYRGPLHSVQGAPALSAVLFPSSSSFSNSELNPPISPLESKTKKPGGPKISRYDKTNYDHLVSLAINVFAQWQRYSEKPELWEEETGKKSFRDVLAMYYPRIVLILMPILGSKWEKGVGRHDANFWRNEAHETVKKKEQSILEMKSITDFHFLELRDLIDHAKNKSATKA